MIRVLDMMKSNKFLTIIVIIYIALGITMPSKAIESFNNSLYYVKEMLIIMPVILLLTSLIEAWVPKKTIQNTLGEDAGVKGYIFSFLLGSFSAGPIYAAFPVCKALLKKGARISNIVIILSAWAVIKVPMLANEAKFLGAKFTLIRWILTTKSIFSMAYCMSEIVKKEDVVGEGMLQTEEGYVGENVLYIDDKYCIGCGLCAKLSPSNFVMKNKKVSVVNEIIKPEEYESIRLTIDKCPASVIKFTVERE